MRIQPYEPPEEPPVPIEEESVEGIDIPGVDGYAETRVKKLLCRMIDVAIEWLVKLKARLRATAKKEK